MPLDQKLDFEQIFQVKRILCSVSQFEVNFLMTHRNFRLASLSMTGALLLWSKQLPPGCPNAQMSVKLFDCSQYFAFPCPLIMSLMPANYVCNTWETGGDLQVVQ